MVGRGLGGYQLQALIGAGGMGEVYRARDQSSARRRDQGPASRVHEDPDRLARFEREARMLAALNHPNICAIYGFEDADGIQFLVLELVDGETLADRLRSRRLSRWVRRWRSRGRSRTRSRRRTKRGSSIAT